MLLSLPRWRRWFASLLCAALYALEPSRGDTSPPELPLPPPCDSDADADAADAALAADTGGAYGYGGRLAGLRRREFSRLEGAAYCDHAGATLPSEALLGDVCAALQRAVLGNPHSGGGEGIAAEAASATLAWLRAPPGRYSVVFTANATAALKLVGEAFPWDAGSRFSYALESHSSVVGLREPALQAGGEAAAVAFTTGPGGLGVALRSPVLRRTGAGGGPGRHLVALPAECNLSGARFEPGLVSWLEGEGALVLLDAAKAASTHPPDLGACQPHFLVLSYYKILGTPTGLGALIVRSDAMPLLRRRAYAGGGAFAALAPVADYAAVAAGTRGLADGTPPFDLLPAVPLGFARLAALGGAPAVDAHAGALAARCAAGLRGLRHLGGQPGAVVYGWGTPLSADASTALCGQGPTVAFNLLDPAGRLLPHAAVAQALALRRVAVRAGCMCNPGACAAALGRLGVDVAAEHAAGRACGEAGAEPGGREEGAATSDGLLRASFGYSSALSDVTALLAACAELFLRPPPPPPPPHAPAAARVAALFVYPLKSARACPPVAAWPLTRAGLLHDRAWAAMGPSGAALTAITAPRLAFLQPVLDLAAGTLTLCLLPCDAQPPPPPLVLPLRDVEGVDGAARVCGMPRACLTTDAAADAWLSAALAQPCRLVRLGGGGGSFANEAARGTVTLITTASVDALSAAVAARAGVASVSLGASRFRANLLVEGTVAYEEDGWTALRTQPATGPPLAMRLAGACARCPLVCRTGEGGLDPPPQEPLRTLTAERLVGGRPRFGVLLAPMPLGEGEGGPWGGTLSVGDALVPAALN